MTADECLIRWAAQEYSIPGHQIERVTITEEHFDGCETCGFGGGIVRAVNIYKVGGRLIREQREDDFSELLAEILEAQP